MSSCWLRCRYTLYIMYRVLYLSALKTEKFTFLWVDHLHHGILFDWQPGVPVEADTRRPRTSWCTCDLWGCLHGRKGQCTDRHMVLLTLQCLHRVVTKITMWHGMSFIRVTCPQRISISCTLVIIFIILLFINFF